LEELSIVAEESGVHPCFDGRKIDAVVFEAGVIAHDREAEHCEQKGQQEFKIESLLLQSESTLRGKVTYLFAHYKIEVGRAVHWTVHWVCPPLKAALKLDDDSKGRLRLLAIFIKPSLRRVNLTKDRQKGTPSIMPRAAVEIYTNV
jgi:hypothetical protein